MSVPPPPAVLAGPGDPAVCGSQRGRRPCGLGRAPGAIRGLGGCYRAVRVVSGVPLTGFNAAGSGWRHGQRGGWFAGLRGAGAVPARAGHGDVQPGPAAGARPAPRTRAQSSPGQWAGRSAADGRAARAAPPTAPPPSPLPDGAPPDLHCAVAHLRGWTRLHRFATAMTYPPSPRRRSPAASTSPRSSSNSNVRSTVRQPRIAPPRAAHLKNRQNGETNRRQGGSLSGSTTGPSQVTTALLDGRRARHRRQLSRTRGRTPPAGRGRAFRFGGPRTRLR
jgi:hypothetical protein